MSAAGPAAELIAVGDELLLGDQVDTNSTWIAGQLSGAGLAVQRVSAVGDDVDVIASVLRDATARADVVVVTGGLGPTQDDLTREALAAAAGVALQRDDAMAEEIAEVFGGRGRPMPANNLRQADLPAGGRWIGRVGTAPAIALEVGGSLVCCLPGVPHEMRAIVRSGVLPAVRERHGLAAAVTRVVRTGGVGESDVAESLSPVVESLGPDGPRLAFLAAGGEVRVKVTARAATTAEAEAAVEPVVERVLDLLGPSVVGLDDDGVEVVIGRLASRAGLTVAVAESITGGGVGARLVGVPGASAWFRGGLITYATASKVALAGLDAARLEADGPVSRSTAEGLAVAAADRLGADVGLGVVGVAGPSTQGGQPVGTVWVAVATPEGPPYARQLDLPARGRRPLQELAATVALTILHRQLVRLTRG